MTGDNGHAGPRVFVGMPGYGELTIGAASGFYRATRLPDEQALRAYRGGSLLTYNFNQLWCDAINAGLDGTPVDYFAMIHADVEPVPGWLDMLIAELEAKDLDAIGVAVPIKDGRGLTSIALDRPDRDTWRPLARLTMAEVYRLPETFTSADVGHPILFNTGLWACRFDPAWYGKVRFTINDRIVVRPDGRYEPQVESEDWYFSRLLHELGLRVGVTRKVALSHRGSLPYPNVGPWGQPFDAGLAGRSPLRDDGPALPDVDGWLRFDEAEALARLARGGRVLEVGSYCGLSTIVLARVAAEVVSVDPHDGRGTPGPRDTLDELRRNLERYGVADRVSVQVGTLAAFAPIRGDLRFDLIYIDGAHDLESVEADIRDALPLLAPEGVLAFHDYGSPLDPDVATAVDRLVARGGELLAVTGSLAVVRPPAAVPLEA